jgi:hypothetical protein
MACDRSLEIRRTEMDPAIIAIILTLVGMAAAFILFIFNYGRYRGSMDNRVSNLEACSTKMETENKCLLDKISTSEKDSAEYSAIIDTVSSRLTKIEETLSSVVITMNQIVGALKRD